MPVEFSSNKKLESLSPRDVLKTGEVFARFEKVQISEISLPEKLDNNLLDELVELFKEEDPDVDTGLAIAGLEDEKVVYKAITSPEHIAALKVMGVEEFSVVAIYGLPDFTVKEADKNDLMHLGSLGAKFTRIEEVPVSTLSFDDDDIVDEDDADDGSLFDKEHSEKLRKDMLKKGQDSPMTVGAVYSGKSVVHEVVDGYHRGKVFVAIGKEICEASVGYGWDEADIYIKRILAASSVKSVAVARFGIWSKKLYEKTKWSKMGLLMSQVATLAISDSSGKILFERDLDEAEEAKKWARSMVKAFEASTGLQLGSALQYIKAFEASDPSVIRKIRAARGGGEIGRGTFTPAKFVALASALEGQIDKQKLVYRINKHHNFNVQQIKTVGEALQKVKDITDKEFLEGFEMDPIGVAVEILSSNEDLGLVEEDEVVEIPTTEDEGVAEKNRRTRNSGRLFIQGTSPTSKFMHNNTNDSKAAAEIIKGSIGKKEGVSDWLKTPGLLSEEAAALRFFLLEGFGIDEVASELGVSSIVAERYFNNAIIKIHLHSREKREAKEAKEARLGLDQD